MAAELEAKAFGRLHFAGYAWALPMMRFDGLEDDQPNENGFWHDATILIELEPGIEPGDIILLEAYQNLMMNTQNDAIVLFYLLAGESPDRGRVFDAFEFFFAKFRKLVLTLTCYIF